VSKPMAIKIVGRQTELREPPKFVESRRVVVYVYDQLYRVDDRHHKQRIGTTALQRVMGTGEESEKKHQVYINWFRIPIPASLVDLDQADLDRIREVGPHSESYDTVYARLRKRQVRAQLRRWINHFSQQVLVVADRLACDVREIGLAGVARGCCARPEIYPGEPTYILTKYPLPDCDTSAYHHITKIFSAAERDVRALFEAAPQQDGLQPPADAENCVKVCFQDGEAFERAGGLKKRSGDRWREFVLWDGPFHNHAHACTSRLYLAPNVPRACTSRLYRQVQSTTTLAISSRRSRISICGQWPQGSSARTRTVQPQRSR